MRKTILFIFVFAMLTLMLTTQLATADYLISNGSATEDAWVIYSTWREASGGWPAGWRTQGWYRVEPGGFRNLWVPEHNTWVYIRVERPAGREVKPRDHGTRSSALFWIHPSEAFTVVEKPHGNFLRGNFRKQDLSRAALYEYRNGGRHTITDEPGKNLPELLGQQIYNQAINSVLWIITPDERSGGVGLGSGVLIDKERRLAVTNAHVTDQAEWVSVFFPWRDWNGTLIKNQEYYLNNRWELESLGYATQGRVIAENFRSDLAIIQLDRLPPTAREIAHDFGLQIEASMKQGDKVHILGNPGNRMWNWTQGSFVRDRGSWLQMEGDAEGGNSGGPVLNAQGLLIGILSSGTDETLAGAVPARDVKALLDTVRPRHTFAIKNDAGFTVPYQIKWSENDAWQQYSLRSNLRRFHWRSGNVPWGYPKIRFDSIPGDGQFTPLVDPLFPFLRYFGFNYRDKIIPGDAHAYVFEFNAWTGRLDVSAEDAALAPALSKTIPKATALLPNYPNPFNPETWVPYQLAKAADVTLTIYAVDGTLVRTLALGHRAAGVYQSKSRAAYWDGRNELGEPVASGIYFYTLTAGDFSATGKMLVRK
ncbi:hypothetical protein C6495_18880 [Candidatus Poribacteria bacterium]|nr:MAG: hypothetical protein C6495_18880 [Candidatus Poribacteria bacterium]